MKISKTRTVLIVLFAGLAGMLVSGGVIAAAAASDSSDLTPGFTHSIYTTNKHGLTVGNPTAEDVDQGRLPDLIPIAFDKGPTGYLRTDELYFPLAKTPKEAVQQMRKLYNEKGELIANIYSEDGRTKLGSEIIAKISVGGDVDESWP